MKLMVAVPTTEYVNVNFMCSLVKLTRHLAEERVDFDVQVIAGTMVYVARERLADRAIEKGFTHVLWLDSDMTFEPEIAEDLLWCGAEMVCGAFVSRRPPYDACVYSSIEDPGNLVRVEKFETAPFRVAGCGFAAVMTSVALLRDVREHFKTCFTPNRYGEDLAFCDRVTQLGREIWCEPTVRPGHIALMPLYAGDNPFGGADQ